MKRRTTVLALGAAVAFPKLCFSQARPSAMSVSETSFAISLYKQLKTAPGNFFVSPYSIAAALGMLYVGA